MKKSSALCGMALAFTLLLNSIMLPAFAQVGFGFGGWGDHFGSWVEFWPWSRCCGYQRVPRQHPPAVQTNGYLEGNVTVISTCPTSQPNTACPLASDTLSDITISAEPYGSNQWLSSRPDARGHYRLSLPSGGYNVILHHPNLGKAGQTIRQIIIQPGQTNQQNFQVTLPIQ